MANRLPMVRKRVKINLYINQNGKLVKTNKIDYNPLEGQNTELWLRKPNEPKETVINRFLVFAAVCGLLSWITGLLVLFIGNWL